MAYLAGAVEYTDSISASRKCPGYDTEQSNSEAPVILELWGMQSTPLLPLLPGPHWPRVVVPERILCVGQIELKCVLKLDWIVWNRTVFMYNNGFSIK